jgi:hypothetical protein
MCQSCLGILNNKLSVSSPVYNLRYTYRVKLIKITCGKITSDSSIEKFWLFTKKMERETYVLNAGMKVVR